MPAQPPAPVTKPVEAGKPTAYVAPVMKPLENPVCQITAASGRTEYAINLLVDKERVFATIGAELTEVDMRLAAGVEGGTITLTREGITLTGQIGTREISLESPSGKLFEDWLEVRGAPVRQVDPDGTLHAFIRHPTFVEPVDAHEMEVPCKEASFFDVTKPPAGTPSELKDGANAPLRLKPGGKIVANVVVPPGSDYSKYNDVIVLEKKGTSARVRIGPFDEVSYAWGWIDGSQLVPQPPRMEPEVDEIEAPPTIRCDHEVSIFVHEGEHPLKVGFAKKGARIPIRDRKAAEPTVDLRLVPLTGPVKYTVQADPLTEAFVTPESVADCR